MRRDGATVHINYKAQFTGQPAARGRTKASARDDLGDADDDIEVLDVEDEEEQSSSKQSRSSRDVSMAHLHMMQGRVERDTQSADQVNGFTKTTTM